MTGCALCSTESASALASASSDVVSLAVGSRGSLKLNSIISCPICWAGESTRTTTRIAKQTMHASSHRLICCGSQRRGVNDQVFSLDLPSPWLETDVAPLHLLYSTAQPHGWPDEVVFRCVREATQHVHNLEIVGQHSYPRVPSRWPNRLPGQVSMDSKPSTRPHPQTCRRICCAYWSPETKSTNQLPAQPVPSRLS